MASVEAMVDELFARLDKNGDGVIEAHEVAQEFKGRLVPDELEIFMAQLDLNHDGQVTREEALTAFRKLTSFN